MTCGGVSLDRGCVIDDDARTCGAMSARVRDCASGCGGRTWGGPDCGCGEATESDDEESASGDGVRVSDGVERATGAEEDWGCAQARPPHMHCGEQQMSGGRHRVGG